MIEQVQELIEHYKSEVKSHVGMDRIDKIKIYTYGEDKCLVVGYWEDITAWDPNKNRMVVIDDIMPRLRNALMHLGVKAVWSDSVAICNQCERIFNVVANSTCPKCNPHAAKIVKDLFDGEIGEETFFKLIGDFDDKNRKHDCK